MPCLTHVLNSLQVYLKENTTDERYKWIGEQVVAV